MLLKLLIVFWLFSNCCRKFIISACLALIACMPAAVADNPKTAPVTFFAFLYGFAFSEFLSVKIKVD